MEVPGGTRIEHSVKADDHAETLPEPRIIRRRHLQTVEERARPEASPETKGNVVDRRQGEDQTVKLRSVGADHSSLFTLSNNGCEFESMTDSTTGEVRHAGVHGKAMPALSRDHQTGNNTSAAMIAACDKLRHGWLFW
jgi:hypothetical protein